MKKNRSQKTGVIEHLFHQNWDAKAKKLKKSLITMTDVQEAIRHSNKVLGSTLSDRNVANFMKDIVRGGSASNNWPDSLKRLRYTAMQRTGKGDVFEFVKYRTGQTEPFPDLYVPNQKTTRHKIESVSMSLEAKKLGRADEAWSIQTAVNLRIIETHLAIYSKLHVVQVSHLQMSVKLKSTEIDGLFLATCREKDGRLTQTLVTCEVKQSRERILADQIVAQAKAALISTHAALGLDLVVPIGLRVIKGLGFHVVEFEPVTREESLTLDELKVASEAVYELEPTVRGI